MSYSKLKEESDLVLSLSKGNLLAFNTLYREYSGRLYSFACGYLKNTAEAEELVQEVFTIIWERRSELNEDLSFKSFLFTIAFNLIKKHFRTRTCIALYLKSKPVDDTDTETTRKITHDSLYQYISKLVEKLPERRREIFIKSRFEGKNISEISEEMKISHKTVENQITDALRFIRTHLNRENFQ